MGSHQLTDDQLDDLFRQAAAKIIPTETCKKAWMRLKARLDKPLPIAKRFACRKSNAGKKRY
jgi:hypothetical protein